MPAWPSGVRWSAVSEARMQLSMSSFPFVSGKLLKKPAPQLSRESALSGMLSESSRTILNISSVSATAYSVTQIRECPNSMWIYGTYPCGIADLDLLLRSAAPSSPPTSYNIYQTSVSIWTLGRPFPSVFIVWLLTVSHARYAHPCRSQCLLWALLIRLSSGWQCQRCQ